MDDKDREKAVATKAKPRGSVFRLGLFCGLLLGVLAGLLIRREAEGEPAETPAPASPLQGPPL